MKHTGVVDAVAALVRRPDDVLHETAVSCAKKKKNYLYVGIFQEYSKLLPIFGGKGSPPPPPLLHHFSPFIWGFTGTLITSPDSRVTSLSSQDLSRTFSGLRSVWMSLIECRNSIACRMSYFLIVCGVRQPLLPALLGRGPSIISAAAACTPRVSWGADDDAATLRFD